MKYGKKRLFLPLTVLALLILFPLSIKLFAQSTNNYDVTISPIFFDLSADPNTNITSKIKIRNNTTSPIPLKLGVQKLSGDTNGNLNLKQDQNDYTLSWIKFSQDSIVAKPLEWTEIPFTVEVPKDAAYGYYWTITFTQDKTSPLARTGVNLTGSAGVPILLNVRKAGAITQGKLASFNSDSSFYEYLPVKFITKFLNTGNVHIRPVGNIFIKDFLGREIEVLHVNNEQGTVLPNSARIFESKWNNGFVTVEPKMVDGEPKVDKNGRAETKLNFKFDKILDFRIGRYTATNLMIVTGANKDFTFQSETSFWVFPWKIIIGIIIFIAFAGIGFYNTIKNFILKILRIFGIKKKKEEESKA